MRNAILPRLIDPIFTAKSQPPFHGSGLFHNMEPVQKDVEFAGVFPQYSLNIPQFQRAIEVDGGITDLAQRKRCEPGAAAILVFTEHLITDPVGTPDLPVASPPFQQTVGRRPACSSGSSELFVESPPIAPCLCTHRPPPPAFRTSGPTTSKSEQMTTSEHLGAALFPEIPLHDGRYVFRMISTPKPIGIVLHRVHDARRKLDHDIAIFVIVCRGSTRIVRLLNHRSIAAGIERIGCSTGGAFGVDILIGGVERAGGSGSIPDSQSAISGRIVSKRVTVVDAPRT